MSGNATIHLPPFWFPGNLHDALYTCAVVGLTALNCKFSLLQKVEGAFPIKVKTGAVITPYLVFSYFAVVGAAIVTFAWNFSYLTAPITDRVFGNPAYGHWLVWLSVFIVLAKYGATDLARGLLFTGLLVAVHEGLWFVTYFVMFPANFEIVAYFYSPFFLLLASFVFAYFVILPRTRRLQRKDLFRLFFLMGTIYLFWALAGFHITLDNITGPTSFFNSLDVNLIEDLSWLIPAVSMVFS